MERDFMGLSVKQEISDEPIDAVPVRSLAMQWSFSNKPQLVSFHDLQQDKLKTGFDSLASTGLVTITTTESFDSDHKSYQKNIVPEQGGVRYTIHQPVTSQANLTVLPAIGGAVHQSFVAATRQNLIGSASPNHHLAGAPVTFPGLAMTSTSPVVGTTDLRNGSKVSGAPAQMTLFYNGSVCVYDNISAEKAQAIMLLAGNGPPSTSSTPPPVQASIPKRPSILESFAVNHPYSTTPNRPGPTHVTSISGSQYTGRSTNDIKSGGVIISSNKPEPRKVINLPGFVSSPFVSSNTVPQFRRKSLARFLEKRKERVNNSSPYTQQSPGSTSLSVNSSS